MTTPTAPVVAPPSVVGGANAQLAAMLTQGQADMTTLTNLLAAWPTDVDVALKPVVEIVQRVLEALTTLGQASAVVAKHTGLAS